MHSQNLTTLLAALACGVLQSRAPAQCPVDTPTGAGAVVADSFGSSVAVSGDLMVVGAPTDSTVGVGAGALWIFERGPAGWVEADKLAVPGSIFLGSDVAIDGERILAGGTGGAPGVQHQDAAYLFERIAGVWTKVATFVPPDPTPDDTFGWSVSLAGDVAIVGRPFKTFATHDGEAFVYERQGGVWVATTVLADGTLHQGAAVATDGVRLLVAHGPEAEVFEKIGGVWTSVANLYPLGATPNWFYKDLCIAGNLAFVPAEISDIVASTHFFEKGPSGWQQTTMIASPPMFESTYHGSTLSYSQGVLLLDSPLYGSSAHGFRRHGPGWFEAFTLVDSGPSAGFAVGTSIDGNTIAVSRPGSASAGIAPSIRMYELGDGLSLFGCPQKVSLAAGGAQSLALDAGPVHAGEFYFLLGSKSGTQPGLAVDGLVLPLNYDPYFLWTLSNPNKPPLAGSLGVLDGAGKKQATWSIPAGTNPALAGFVLNHAFVAVDLAIPAVVFTSGPTPIVLAP